MEHRDHVNLIKKGVPKAVETWADLGCGTGEFTLALADCLAPEATIYAVDLNERLLTTLEGRMKQRFPQTQIITHRGDFTQTLALPPLDGIVMANALHFVQDKIPVVKALRALLKPGGRFVLVEYDTDESNYAVPHPLTSTQWDQLASACGFVDTTIIATRPSRFLGSFFCSLSVNAF